MRALIGIALRSAWNRRLTLGLTLLSITLATTLLLSVERLRVGAREGFSQSVSGTDLVVGTRTSPVQLILYSVFHIGEATSDIGWESYRKIAQDPSVAWSVPLALGDSHRNFPVVGTTDDYFRYLHYGGHQSLRLATGRPFADIFETVLGADVAKTLAYRSGDTIVLNHGSGAMPGAEHTDKPFTVVGVLAPTGTPVDRTVHVSLHAIEAIHLDWQGGVQIPGVSIPANMVHKFDLTPKRITAALMGLHHRSDVFSMQRRIAAFRAEPLLAAMPGVALDQLWQTVSIVEETIRAISWLVFGVGLSGMVAVILASLNERRRELAILRSVGAGPRHIVLLLLLESLCLTLAGCLFGLLLVNLATLLAGPWLAAELGVVLTRSYGSADELKLLATVLATGLLISLIPAWRAQHLSLADGLTPRV